jgi:hypothetical protein
MRRLPLLVAVLVVVGGLWPDLAQAQTSYTITTQNAAQDLRIERGRIVANEETCQRQGYPVGCTQAQACVPVGRPPCAGGASCTAAQARAAACNARIYPNTQAGREEMLAFETMIPGLQKLKERGQSLDANAFCEVTWVALTLTERHNECVRAGRGAGSSTTNPCDMCP